MTLTMKDWYRHEEGCLAPYAQRSQDSRGRKHPESEHQFRAIYQRDRDRVIHSRAFRRLEYKTQVFVNHEGDHYRTRLTHSLEVASIARTICRALKLNEDLCEAIALAHDLGHSPFGHSGENALSELMAAEGGFEHNMQGLRVVDLLEQKYPDHPGLNLTWEVREGIAKHKSAYDRSDGAAFDPAKASSLEAQVVDISDEIAYNCHDVDDGLASGLLTEDRLMHIPLWNDSLKDIRSTYPRSPDEVIRYYSVRALIDKQAKDVIFNTEKTIKEAGIASSRDVRDHGSNVVRPSPAVAHDMEVLKSFLLEKLYMHPQVMKMNRRAMRIVKELFATYLRQPELLNISTRRKTEETSLSRVVCDYIAGMTDRFAMTEHARLCGGKADESDY